MTLMERMLGNIQSSQSASIIQPGTGTAQKPGNSDNKSVFSDILGSKINHTETKNITHKNDTGASAAANLKGSSSSASAKDGGPRFLSYREANANASKTVSNNSSAARRVKITEDTVSQPEETEQDVKAEAVQGNAQVNMIQALAQMLGIGVNDLRKLFQEAGITSESFNNMKNVSEACGKLSQLLGLNSEQQDTLMQLFSMAGQTLGFAETVNTAATQEQSTLQQETPLKDNTAATSFSRNETVNAASATGTSIQEAAGEQVTTRLESLMDSLLEKLNAKIKIRLNELGNRLENDQSSVETELAQILQSLSDKTAVKIQAPLPQDDSVNTGEATVVPETTAAASQEGATAQEESDGKETPAKQEKAAVVQQTAIPVKETQPQMQQVFTVVQPDKAVNAEMIQKTAVTDSGVEPKEIISQVIEKAKVILTADKSEMIMDLKPDSLGKISLKVVTENGMVMAKFVADSQQVRQVLETNMQVLKDSLESQGLNVQGFSVSVRQDSNRSAEKWTQPDNGRNRGLDGTTYRSSGIAGSLDGTIRTPAGNNPYAWGESTINLTA